MRGSVEEQKEEEEEEEEELELELEELSFILGFICHWKHASEDVLFSNLECALAT